MGKSSEKERSVTKRKEAIVTTPRDHIVEMCGDHTSKIGAHQLLTKLRKEDDDD